jgi:ribosomal protein S12 methylthiotransferase accessory factor
MHDRTETQIRMKEDCLRKKELLLQDVYKGFSEDTEKTVSPSETVKRFKEKLQTAGLDILERTVRIDNGRLDIPVYFSICGSDALSIIGVNKQMGKGGSPEQAEASAIMELAERFSFYSYFENGENFLTDTCKNVSSPLEFDLIRESVHDDIDDPGVTRKIFEQIPLKWTFGWNLTRNEPATLPFDWFYTINEFNGTSAGNCNEEAICQGICEVVERHVCSLISKNGIKTPAINPESVTDPFAVELMDKFHRKGIQLYISDFSLDLGIPTVSVLAVDPSTFPQKSEIVWTAGTSTNPQKALCRALTETAQLGGDFNTGSNYIPSGLPKLTSLTQADFIVNPEKMTDIGNLPDISDSSIKTEIESLVDRLSQNRMEVLLVETTHPQLKIPAFYTIIPGSHFRERTSGTSVGMFCSKIVFENTPSPLALIKLEEMDRLLPGKYYNRFYMGSCMLNMGESGAAIEHFQKALGLNPPPEDLVSIYSYMAIGYRDLEQYDDALNILKTAEKLDRERTDIYNLMGVCHYKKQEYDKAIGCFENVLRIDPGSAIDYANIGVNYRAMGQIQKAIDYYERSLVLDPGIEFARNHLEELKNNQ